jgi:2-dehydro-3-deoxygluconokinase
MSEAVVVGECMVELRLAGEGAAAIGYAGDTFNTAVYLSRLGVKTAYATALGRGDPFSAAILELMGEEGLARDLVVEAAGRLPGLYAIECDERGERSFYYWRENAPARDYMALADLQALGRAMGQARLVYLSGITLAILREAGRAALLPLLAAAREKGAAIALDTNYRARLWPGPEAAWAAMQAFAPLCRWISSSQSDLEALGQDPQARAEAWSGAGAEVLLRMDSHEIRAWSDGGRERLEPQAATGAVDTTGAGDSFNAAYLAGRLRGAGVADAVAAARALAAAVVGHSGAIIPKSAMPPAAG